MSVFRRRKKGILSEGYLWILMAGLLYVLGLFTRDNSAFLERIYPASWNRALIRILSRITGVMPVSLGEFFVYANVAAGVVLLILLLKKIFTGGFFTLLYRIVTYAALLYFVFMLVFGLNYNRASLREDLALERVNYGTEELILMNEALIERANELRGKVSESDEGVFTLAERRNEIFALAEEGYDAFSEAFPQFGGEYGIAKGIIASEALNYTGITGIFMPFTGEANVNIKGPDLLFPATVLHEMAHQRGIAYEDEANYMAFLVSSYHGYEPIRYSGTMLALINSMNALYKEDRESYRALYETYSEGVKRDLRAYSVFYDAYEGEVNERATKVNDTYLKSNGQVSGVKSYGEMVNLLLEQFMQKGEVVFP
ncbi:DUF3810 domain-containing protein [Proteiniclasticum sp. C24MP]|uniref:DUF3810 domain-containing protein n=1 Tax=Proteiniclasticum sp. C24MP TaxID=3374101 RepID=UPI00375450A6